MGDNKKEREGKESDIEHCTEFDYKLSYCKNNNKDDFVFGSPNVIDHDWGKKKDDSTKQNESIDKEEKWITILKIERIVSLRNEC